jgi:hypothetical protein
MDRKFESDLGDAMNARQLTDQVLNAFTRLLTQIRAACRRGDEAALAELREAWTCLERSHGRAVAPLEVYALERPDKPSLSGKSLAGRNSPPGRKPIIRGAAHGSDPRLSSDDRRVAGNL